MRREAEKHLVMILKKSLMIDCEDCCTGEFRIYPIAKID